MIKWNFIMISKWTWFFSLLFVFAFSGCKNSRFERKSSAASQVKDNFFNTNSSMNLKKPGAGNGNPCHAYPKDYFRACYFSSELPFHQQSLLGSVDESVLSHPAPLRYTAIDHNWSYAPIFGTTLNMITSVWRGRIFFEKGNYHFTLRAGGFFQLYVDEVLYINHTENGLNTRTYGLSIKGGYHKIRVVYFKNKTGAANKRIKFYWDKVPTQDVAPTTMNFKIFIAVRQEVCIAGEEYISGTKKFSVFNSDNSIYASWQLEGTRVMGYKPSDSRKDGFEKVECFSFGFTPDELAFTKGIANDFISKIENYSFGNIQANYEIIEVQGEIGLSPAAHSLWLSAFQAKEITRPHHSDNSTDFTIMLAPHSELGTGRYFRPSFCGLSFHTGGSDWIIGGSGYSWIPYGGNANGNPYCMNTNVVMHEWDHQVEGALYNAMKLEKFDYLAFDPLNCGTHVPDTFKWYPPSHNNLQDPDAPWCGETVPGTEPITAHHLGHHFDFSYSHTPLKVFTGTTCRNGILDKFETEIDVGSNCL